MRASAELTPSIAFNNPLNVTRDKPENQGLLIINKNTEANLHTRPQLTDGLRGRRMQRRRLRVGLYSAKDLVETREVRNVNCGPNQPGVNCGPRNCKLHGLNKSKLHS